MPLEGSQIFMLGHDQPLKWHLEGDWEYEMQGTNLVIDEIPESLPGKHAWSFKIQILDKAW